MFGTENAIVNPATGIKRILKNVYHVSPLVLPVVLKHNAIPSTVIIIIPDNFSIILPILANSVNTLVKPVQIAKIIVQVVSTTQVQDYPHLVASVKMVIIKWDKSVYSVNYLVKLVQMKKNV